MFVGPSVCCGLDTGWTPEDVWDTGFLTDYADQLAWISVEQYVPHPLPPLSVTTHSYPI